MTGFLVSYVIVIIEAIIMVMNIKYDMLISAVLLAALLVIYSGEVKELSGTLLQKITKRGK